ncbi:MAG: energy transducer TonB [Methylophilaceae bacterium]|nr:energy transducer TonB [Methylophilaceae bacterium]
MPRISLGAALAISVFVHTVVIGSVLKQNSLLIDHTKEPLTLTVQIEETQAPLVATVETQTTTKKVTNQETYATKKQKQINTKKHALRQQQQLPSNLSLERIDASPTEKTLLLNTENLKETEPIKEKTLEVLSMSKPTLSTLSVNTQSKTETIHAEKINENASPVHEKTGVSISASYAKNNQKPEYPTMSRRLNEQGTVVLLVLVLEDGTAGKVDIKRSSGFPLLDDAAKVAVIQWHFIPAKIDGKPINESYSLSIPFVLN